MELKNKTKDELLKLADELEVEVEAKKANKPTKKEVLTSIEDFAEESEENANELEEVYSELFGEDDEVSNDTKAASKVFTYVGGGESSPQVINFMGRQKFVRGRAEEVTDEKLLAKIVNNPSFVRGEVEPEDLQELEDSGIAVANKNREVDKKMNEAFLKEHGGE